MINAMRAYLKTEGKLDYRECQIAYYTYSMFETPNKYHVNVNVHIQTNSTPTKKTLNLDDSFDKESDAIDFGIDAGKKYIDKNYEIGKIVVMSPQEQDTKKSSLKPSSSSKQQDVKKKDQR